MFPVRYFFVIACLCSWAVWIPLALSRAEIIAVKLPMPLYFLGAFGPMVGALFAVRKFKPMPVKQWLQQCFSFRTSLRWYAAAILLPLLIYALAALAVYWWNPNDLHFNAPLNGIVVFFSMLFVVVGEELGWRGFALPYLQRRHNALGATLWVWLMWGIWHIPAFFVSGVFTDATALMLAFVGFMALLLPFSIVFTWLHNASGGKAMMAVLLHAAVAAASTTTNVAAVQPVAFVVAFTGVFLLVAIVMLVRFKQQHLAFKQRTQL